MIVRLVKDFKFAPPLHRLLRVGAKYATWRLFYDGPELRAGDGLILCGPGGLDDQLAHARVIEVITRPLGELTDEEKSGHENYDSPEDMYQTFSGYYSRPVDATTEVLVVKFEVLAHFVGVDNRVVVLVDD